MTSDQIRAVGEVISRTSRGFATAFASARHELGVTLAWSLVTWGVFGFSIRAWAISIGAYLVVDALLAAFAGRVKNVRN